MILKLGFEMEPVHSGSCACVQFHRNGFGFYNIQQLVNAWKVSLALGYPMKRMELASSHFFLHNSKNSVAQVLWCACLVTYTIHSCHDIVVVRN